MTASIPHAPLRSLLFAPGTHARRVEKALASAANAVIIDLEDAVPPTEKAAARSQVLQQLGKAPGGQGPRVYVRVNGLDTVWCYPDVLALVGTRIEGFVIPKVVRGADLATLDWLLTQLERERGLPPGGLALLPLIEDSRAILGLEEITTASSRVRCLAFGGADYALDLRLQSSPEESELAFARARLVHCSRAANLAAPIDSVTLEIRDPVRLANDVRRTRQFGFQGKLCIHPDQIAIVNAAFAPDEAELARARAIVAAYAAATARGEAAVQVDGLMVDAPIAARASFLLQSQGASPGEK
jgi:citrate lyase subunit beta/citryl-CoA lyase